MKTHSIIQVEAEEYEDYEALYENATKIEATNDTDIEIDNNIESINETSTNTYTSVDNSTDSQDLLNLIAVSVTHFMAIFI